MREIYGHHTCDKRRPRSEIEKDFPNFVFEDGFVEEDVLWTEERETYDHLDGRARNVLDRIFEVDTDATCESTFLVGRFYLVVLKFGLFICRCRCVHRRS